jgi:hypothetical protein
MLALPPPGPVGRVSERPGLVVKLLGVLALLLGAGGGLVGALTGLTAVLTPPAQHPEVLIDALPVPGPPRVPLGALTLDRGAALQAQDLAGRLGRIAVQHRAPPVALRTQLSELVTLTPFALLGLPGYGQHKPKRCNRTADRPLIAAICRRGAGRALVCGLLRSGGCSPGWFRGGRGRGARRQSRGRCHRAPAWSRRYA